MSTKSSFAFVFIYLIGSTLCVIPEGEYQIGPVFGPSVSRFFGHKHFEAFIDKGQINKPLLAKKVLLGVGAVAAAGGAALIAKKIHQNKGFGFGHEQGKGWYPQESGSGWHASSGGIDYNNYNQVNQVYQTNDYNQGYGNGNVNFPSTSYQYPTSQGYGDYSNGGYDTYGQSNGYGWSQ